MFHNMFFQQMIYTALQNMIYNGVEKKITKQYSTQVRNLGSACYQQG